MAVPDPQPLVPLLTILKCARPVLFSNADPDFPYSARGTAFVVTYLERHYVVTAKHVLRGFEPGQVRIQTHPEANQFVPLVARYQFPADDAIDTDQFDVVVWEVDRAFTADQCGDYPPYDLHHFDVWPINPGASPYLYRGYLTEHRRIDYAAREYGLDSVSGEARYVGRSGYRCIHAADLLRVDQWVQSLDGLSGSPIFQVSMQEERYASAVFAGMLIRGAREANRVHFVEQQRIVELVHQASHYREGG
jgi:hypothetical protein